MLKGRIKLKNNINLKKEIIDKIYSFNTEDKEQTIVGIREKYQYGTSLSLKEDIYKELFNLTKEIISKTKEIIEK